MVYGEDECCTESVNRGWESYWCTQPVGQKKNRLLYFVLHLEPSLPGMVFSKRLHKLISNKYENRDFFTLNDKN